MYLLCCVASNHAVKVYENRGSIPGWKRLVTFRISNSQWSYYSVLKTHSFFSLNKYCEDALRYNDTVLL